LEVWPIRLARRGWKGEIKSRVKALKNFSLYESEAGYTLNQTDLIDKIGIV
jgi:hypothetical protein